MSCLFNFKIILAIIGFRYGGIKGMFFGILLGWLLDLMFHRPTVRVTYTYRTTDTNESNDSQNEEQGWQPYVDITLQEAYRTLGVRETASADEVRQAYRQMALRYHPDRVVAKNEAERKDAEKKFREVTEARDIIFRSRGI